MTLSPVQKKTAQAIVNIFETGKPAGDYGRVVVVPGDTGHLTYGRSQTTLASGNLYLLVRAYVNETGAAYAPGLRPYLEALGDLDLRLDRDRELHALLAQAGQDPVMQQVQDGFFDRIFWAPTLLEAEKLGIGTGIGATTIYDSLIHGSWARMRDRTLARAGAPQDLGEQDWVEAYVKERRAWLAGHSSQLLRRTVYRMDEVTKLIEDRNWALNLPIRVRGQNIDHEVLGMTPPMTASAEEAGTRNLRRSDPPMTGADVAALEEALKTKGYALNIDGIFDESLDRVVRSFQDEAGLTVDGIVGPSTRAALGL